MGSEHIMASLDVPDPCDVSLLDLSELKIADSDANHADRPAADVGVCGAVAGGSAWDGPGVEAEAEAAGKGKDPWWNPFKGKPKPGELQVVDPVEALQPGDISSDLLA